MQAAETATTPSPSWEISHSPNPALKTRYKTINLHRGILTASPSPPPSQPQSSGSETEESATATPKPPSIRALGDWALTKTLGTGSTGKVRLAIHRESGEKLAVKIVWRGDNLRHFTGSGKEKKSKESPQRRERRIMREAALLNVLHHPNIVQLRDLLVMPDFFALFFEHVEGGQMLDYIIAHGKLKEQVAQKFFRQLLSAVAYCHGNSIVHRDLKIENVLIDSEGNIKLIDFGLSNLWNPDSALKTFCGSLYFAAPELLHGKIYVGPEVDVWSLGVICYVLVCGKVPFDDKSLPNLHAKIKACNLEIPMDLSEECRDLLSRMIVADPGKRATLAEVMQHPWTLHNEGEIETFLPTKQRLAHIDWRIVETVCHEFEIEPKIAEQVMKGALREWEVYENHEIVSLYFLTLQKQQREASINKMMFQPKPVHGVVANSPTSCNNILPISKRIISPFKVKTVYLRGLLSVSTTTSSEKTPMELAQEIARVLELNRIRYEFRDATFYCEYSPSIARACDDDERAVYSSRGKVNPFLMQFRVQIVKVAFLGGVLGVQFGRILGDSRGYKNVCAHLLAEMKL